MSEARQGGPEGWRCRDVIPPGFGAGKQSKRALDAMFAGIVSIAADAIVSVDAEQRIILFNRGAEEMFGYTAEEALGRRLDILLPESVRSVHREHVRGFGESATQARRMGERGTISGRRKDGEVFVADASISKIEVEGERIYTAALRDIGASLRSEEALERAHETLQALIRAAPLAIVAVDPDTNVDIWNPAAERLFGWSQEEVIGLPYPAVPEDQEEGFREEVLAARRGEESLNIETERLRKDGSRLTVRVSTAPLQSARGEFRGTMALIEDVTEQKAAREEQERLHRETRRAVRLRDEVLRVVAHDLRDPLSTIGLSAGLLRETVEGGVRLTRRRRARNSGSSSARWTGRTV